MDVSRNNSYDLGPWYGHIILPVRILRNFAHGRKVVSKGAWSLTRAFVADRNSSAESWGKARISLSYISIKDMNQSPQLCIHRCAAIVGCASWPASFGHLWNARPEPWDLLWLQSVPSTVWMNRKVREFCTNADLMMRVHPEKKQERNSSSQNGLRCPTKHRTLYPPWSPQWLCVCHKRHVNSQMWAGILFLRYLKSKYDNTFKFTVFPRLHAGKHLHVEFLIILVKEKI